MLTATFVEAALRSPSIWATVIILGVTLLVRSYLERPAKAAFPVAEIDITDQNASLMRAKTKFGNKPFHFNTNEERIVLPNYLFEEVKNLPDNQLSFREQVRILMNAKWTGLGDDIPQFAAAVQNELTMNINSTLATLKDEISYVVEKELGSCPEAKEVNIFQKLLTIIAFASGRIFVGLPLSRDEEWIDITINYTVNASQSITDVQALPRWLRWCCVPFVKSIRQSRYYRRRIQEKLEPLVQPLIEASKRANIEAEDDDSIPDATTDEFSLAAWSLKYYPAGQKITAASIAQTILSGSFAAIHTTSITLTQILYDLAAHPECISILRTELEAVLNEDPQGKLHKKTIPKLRKMDSLMKESQRVRPLGPAILLRRVMAKNGLDLSSGDHLPYGSCVVVAQARQTGALSPEYLSPQPPQPSLDEFHPWRFSDLRNVPGEENKHQFVTTTCESTVFGHGKWACPGRFFASNEIKSILVVLLQRYDISLGPNGEGEGEKYKRPTTYNVDMGYIPDPMAKIYFKDRKG